MQTHNPNNSVIKMSLTWMILGLVIATITSFITITSQPILNFFAASQWIFWGFLIAKLALVWYLSANIDTLSTSVARGLFIIYAATTGIFFGIVLLAYAGASVFGVFLSTVAVFGVLAMFGYKTERDLSSWGRYLTAGLIGIIIAAVINIFIGSTMADLIINIIGVIVFTGFTAYDMQRIKYFNTEITDPEMRKRYGILGALSLFLDFINLFLSLLRIFGRR